ncbi:hypothetical protein BLNAU_7770 [Blattamonas nauphoetae]|uniref:Uncharacterized protein n=1 Tax=Blattamonas nauphoetae TaxID=2049346 RepID=A0ABQ9Y0A9_9EUKA|nr:hypothetical protein BLNAU_7770 [Blattamonas nauphoetae]
MKWFTFIPGTLLVLVLLFLYIMIFRQQNYHHLTISLDGELEYHSSRSCCSAVACSRSIHTKKNHHNCKDVALKTLQLAYKYPLLSQTNVNRSFVLAMSDDTLFDSLFTLTPEEATQCVEWIEAFILTDPAHEVPVERILTVQQNQTILPNNVQNYQAYSVPQQPTGGVEGAQEISFPAESVQPAYSDQPFTAQNASSSPYNDPKS